MGKRGSKNKKKKSDKKKRTVHRAHAHRVDWDLHRIKFLKRSFRDRERRAALGGARFLLLASTTNNASADI